MSDDPILGVAAAEPLAETPPELEQPTPAPEDLAAPPRLDRDGKRVIGKVLEVEGEIVRALRGVPAEEPTAWRWTPEEVEALMPALEGLAERYGIAEQINEYAPQAGAGIAVALHVNRSLAAERAWRDRHADTTTPEETDGPPADRAGDGAPARAPESVPEPAGDEPRQGLGTAGIARVADHIGSDGIRGGG